VRRRPSWLLGQAAGCGRRPADVPAIRDTVAYEFGLIDGRAQEHARWAEELARLVEIIDLEEAWEWEAGAPAPAD
jgi:hypothetical protein